MGSLKNRFGCELVYNNLLFVDWNFERAFNIEVESFLYRMMLLYV